MAWSSHLLSTGSRDRSILHRDIRTGEDVASRQQAHRSEVRLEFPLGFQNLHWARVVGNILKLGEGRCTVAVLLFGRHHDLRWSRGVLR
jgi:hypothetical protein